MSIIVSCDYEEAKGYKNIVNTKVNGKKHRVYFNVTCDDFSLTDAINLAFANSSILSVEYNGSLDNMTYKGLTKEESKGVYIFRRISSGNNITEEDIVNILEDVPEAVIPVICLPQDFVDIQFVCDACAKYQRVRFTGGRLFSFDGVRASIWGLDILDRASVKHPNELFYRNDSDCCIDVFDSSEGLEFEFSDKPESVKRKSNTSVGASGGSKRRMLFADIMSSGVKIGI